MLKYSFWAGRSHPTQPRPTFESRRSSDIVDTDLECICSSKFVGRILLWRRPGARTAAKISSDVSSACPASVDAAAAELQPNDIMQEETEAPDEDCGCCGKDMFRWCLTRTQESHSKTKYFHLNCSFIRTHSRKPEPSIAPLGSIIT